MNVNTIKKLESEGRISMNYIVEMNRIEHRWGVNISGISSVACWVCDCVCVCVCVCRGVESA